MKSTGPSKPGNRRKKPKQDAQEGGGKGKKRASSSKANGKGPQAKKGKVVSKVLEAPSFPDWMISMDGPPPPTIHLVSGKPLPPPGPAWGENRCAKEAAMGQAYFGRLAGWAQVTITTTQDVLDRLQEENLVPIEESSKGSRKIEVQWDDSGEYSTPEGQIPLSRLFTALDKKQVKVSKEDQALLHSIWALQYPECSPWKRPAIRMFTRTQPATVSSSSTAASCSSSSASAASKGTSSWVITMYVYFSRLLFEIIADPDIQGVMKRLAPPGKVHPTAKLREHPAIFTTSASQDGEHDFSLPGILKKAESKGYTIRDPSPPGLRVELFEYQRSTFQWMRDHEHDSAGLNGYFWEAREWADGSAEDTMYYFPLAGECRLIKPPHCTGGLLAEEMGLGKTVELLAVVLGNKRPESDVGVEIEPPGRKSSTMPATIITSRATLVVVPASLLGQWMAEINKVCVPGAVTTFVYPGTHQGVVDTDQCQDLNGKPLTDHIQERTILAPWASEVEVDVPEGEDGDTHGDRRLYKAKIDRRLPGGQLQVTFTLEELEDHDLVLTTYDSLRAHGYLFKRIGWWRCVLDECQEIRTATTQIARMCSCVPSVHRWMISGTPLASSIDDLNGELAFLSVWPFCLSNNTDGFWEHKVGRPFRDHEPQALELLSHLIAVTMIRHSKSQKYLDGRPLLTIPSRVITWQAVDCVHQSEMYIYSYIEHLASTECTRLADFLADVDALASNPSANNNQRGGSHSKLRALLWALQRCVTHPSLVNTTQLDALKRSLQIFHKLNSAPTTKEGEIPKLRVDDILMRLQGLGASRVGGLTRDVGRNWALGGDSLMEARAKYEALGLAELRRQITEHDLPMPMTWLHLPARGSISKGAKELRCWPYRDEKGKGPAKDDKEDRHEGHDADKPLPSVRALMGPQDLIRVGDNDEQSEATVVQVGEEGKDVKKHEDPRTTVVTLAGPWTADTQKKGSVYRRAPASRKKAYVDLLLAKDKEEKGQTTELHEAGFAAIYKLLEGKDVSCPVCLCSISEPTITMCCHAFCKVCILSQLESTTSEWQTNTRCAVCRKPVSRHSLMQMDTESVEAFTESQDSSMKEGGGGGSSSAAVDDADENGVEPTYEGKGKGRASACNGSSGSSAGKRRSRSAAASASSSSSSSSSGASAQGEGADPWDVRLPHVGFPPAADEDILRSIPDPFYHQRDARTPSLDPSFLAHYENCRTTISSKAGALLKDMARQLQIDPTSKFVVFSQFSDAVALLQQQLTSQGYRCVSISGSTAKTERVKAVSTFTKDPKCTVFLLTVGAGAVGLTLTAANVLYLLEPTHSLADEAQALNRAHRIGQQRPVRCTIFFVKGTVEERILAARRKEDDFLGMLDSSEALSVCRFGDVDKEKGTHFSLDQLSLLFGVDGAN